MYEAGGIKYTIEADAAALLQAEALIDKSLEKQSKAFKEADVAVRAFEKTQSELGRTITSNGLVMNKNNKVLVEQTKEYRQLAAAANTNYEAMLRQTQVTQGVNRAMSGMGNNMTNLSYQLQDIAVQAQMGMNPFMIAAQQLPQMLVGMGAFAAGIGAAVAVAGGLAMAFIDTRTEAEKLEDQIEKIKAVITLSASGVANYSDEMMRLAKISEQLAKIKLAATLREQEIAIKQSAAAIKEEWSEQGTLFSNTNATIAKELKVSTGVIQGFDKAIRGVAYNPTVEQIDKLESALKALQSAGGDATSEGRSLINNTVDMIQKFKEGQITVEALKSSLDDIGSVQGASSSSFNSLTESMNAQLIELEKGERAAFEYSLTLEGLSAQQKEDLLLTYDRIKAKKREIEAQKELTREIEEYSKLGQQYIDEDIKRQEQLAKERERLRGQAMKVGATPLEDIQLRYEAEYELLRTALEKEAITKEEYAQREIALNKEKVDSINAYNAQQIKNQQMFTDTQGQMLGALGNVFGTFAQSMDKSNKESFEKQKKFAIAQALVNTLLSVSYAMANPWPLNLALAAAAGISGAATVAQINSQQFSGAREMGGPVSAGNTYRVGERGNEAFITNSGQVMFTPSENGQIVSNKDLFGQQQQSPNVSMTFNVAGDMSEQVKNEILNNPDLIYAAVAATKHQNGEMF